MNIDRIVRRIKRDIGIYGMALPIDNVDKLIGEILVDTTLPVFSMYQPAEEWYPLDGLRPVNRESTQNMGDLYILPDFPGRKLLYVKGVKYNEPSLCSNYNPVIGIMRTGTDNFSTFLDANVGKNIIDGMINSVTFEFNPPRELLVYDALVSARLTALLAFEHDRSFATIAPTAEESFYKLAVLDVKAGLYPTIKHYEGLDTPLGRIELKIDDWQNAAQDRKDLLQQWDEDYLLDAVDLMYQ